MPAQGRVGGLVAALAVLWLVLVVPNSLPRMQPAAFLRMPLELPVLLLAIALAAQGRFPPAIVRATKPLLALVILASLVLRLADAGAFEAFDRPFDPVLDRHLFGAAWNLLSGTIGPAMAALSAAGILAALVSIFAVLVLALGRAGGAFRSPARIAGLAAAFAVMAALKAGGVAGVGGGELVTREASHSLADHAAATVAGIEDRSVFAEMLALDPLAGMAQSGRLRALAGKDVVLVFVESYGRSAVEGACCATRTRQALGRFEARLGEAGYVARTGYLASPVVGGQSWLAHATALSGLPVESQQRYGQLLASHAETLVDDFRKAGWRTAAIMPAITLDWPEGRRLGYDAIYDRDRLGYRGKPFGWVTMPDQFTLSALDRQELSRPAPRRPVMAEVALISSHAPFTPIPDVIDWRDVGDGRAFDRFAEQGPSPEEVWSDPARVREQFSLSIAYSLDALSSFVLEQADRDLVLVILGDHQPAPLVTGPGAGRDVPVHVVARDPAVVGATAAWGFTEGMIPREGTPTSPMQDLRGRLVGTFTPDG